MACSVPQVLDEVLSLPDETVATYRRDGHVVVRRAFPPDALRALRDDILAAFERNRPASPQRRNAYERAFVQVVNMGAREPAVAALTHCRRLASIAAALLGARAVRIFVEDAMFKFAGDGPTPWHQDASTMPLAPAHAVTVWLPLRDVGPNSGRLRFVSGSHELGLVGPIDISEATQVAYEAVIVERGLSVVENPPLELGDVSAHDGCTIHSAFANDSEECREVLAIHCFAEGALVVADNERRAALLHQLAPRLRPGDVAEAPAWPKIWP